MRAAHVAPRGEIRERRIGAILRSTDGTADGLMR